METLKDQLKVRKLGTVTPLKIPVTLEDRGQSLNQPRSLGYYRDYKVTAEIGMSFSACDAMLETQTRMAQRCILETMFLDVRKHLHHLRLAIAGGHIGQALEIVDQIDNVTTVDSRS